MTINNEIKIFDQQGRECWLCKAHNHLEEKVSPLLQKFAESNFFKQLILNKLIIPEKDTIDIEIFRDRIIFIYPEKDLVIMLEDASEGQAISHEILAKANKVWSKCAHGHDQHMSYEELPAPSIAQLAASITPLLPLSSGRVAEKIKLIPPPATPKTATRESRTLLRRACSTIVHSTKKLLQVCCSFAKKSKKHKPPMQMNPIPSKENYTTDQLIADFDALEKQQRQESGAADVK